MTTIEYSKEHRSFSFEKGIVWEVTVEMDMPIRQSTLGGEVETVGMVRAEHKYHVMAPNEELAKAALDYKRNFRFSNTVVKSIAPLCVVDVIDLPRTP